MIALVVTIIVLLILAGISISMLSGDNGILQKATDAKINTENAQIKEKIQLAYHSALTGGQGSYTKESLENELEKEFGENNYNVDDSDSDNWVLTAKGQSVTIPAGMSAPSPVLTIGSEYEKGNIKIGDKLTYSANGQTDWIVFGKDESGNVLLASETPVGSYALTYGAKNWLTWEDDLDAECDDYGTTLQGKTIQARSIRIEDINRVVGFTEPEFKTYKFTTDAEGDEQFANGKVNYYYPSLDAASNSPAYLQKATVTTLTATAPNVPAKEFELNSYNYKYDTSSEKYKLSWYPNGISRIDDINLTKANNMKYAVGETGSFMQYFIASRSVWCGGNASFKFAYVGGGVVYRGDIGMCYCSSSGGYSGGGPSGWGLRPIVILPSDIEVKEISTGVYDIK